MSSKKTPLTKPQERRLGALKRQMVLFEPNEKTPAWARRLVDKGVARFIPGLIDECPQGVEAI